MDTAQLIADAEAILDEWGEDVVYTPRGGTARTIVAVVERSRPDAIPGASAGMSPSLVIRAMNRATAKADDGYGGVLASAVDKGGDTVALAVVQGGTAQTRRIAAVVSQDEAMIGLELR